MNRLDRTLALTVIGLFLLEAPEALRGQTIPSPFEFLEARQEAGLFFGPMSPGTGRFGYGPGPGISTGARYGIHLGGPFGLEGVASFLPTSRDLIDPGRDEGDRIIGDVESRMVSLDARLRFSLTGDRTWHGIIPFLFTGGGVAFDVAGEDQAEEALLADDRFEFGTSFLGLLGGGVRWFPGERLILRADLSLTMWRLKAPRGFRDPQRGFEGVEEKEWVSGPGLSLGAGFRF